MAEIRDAGHPRGRFVYASPEELDIVRVRKEVEALHLAIPLLAEEQELGRTWVGLAASVVTLSRDWN